MVEVGKTAVVHVTARVADGEEAGTVFETTDVDVAMAADVYEPHRDYVPVEFEVGAGDVPPAVDAVVRGMSAGEERTVTAGPADAYGPRRPDAVVDVDREVLAERGSGPVAVGEVVAAENGESGWITAVDDETVTVDFNHEFAGERVTFEVRVLAVRDDDSGEKGGGDGGTEGGDEGGDDTDAGDTDAGDPDA